jgi:ADP-ribose pyrophosphatase YjhB (NUDIX family)
VLLDPADRVLLFRLEAARDPDGRGYWYLPGGGIRIGESPESAAARELREETGIREVELGRVIGQRSGVRFVFRGRVVVQDEWYVAGRVASPRVGVGRGHDGERDAVTGHRWWSASDLAATAEVVFPPELAELIARAVRG